MTANTYQPPHPSEDLFPLPTKPRLLVVDDQAANIQVLYQILSHDYQVLMATSGAQALALCASKQPDLVLLDLIMPEMDGYQVCQRLKADSITRDIPVIFITAQTDESAEEKGLDLGAVDFISKPINPRIVRARIKTHLILKAQSDLLRSWAYLDGLTGVHNRRFFDERVNAEMGRAIRNQTALSLVMLDVDFFKRFNDHYGHQAGDDCLRRVAKTLKTSLMRSSDNIARYGGEEFVCLLPDTGFAGAMQLAETIRKDVINLQIEHATSSVAPFVTVSLGIGCKPEKAHGSANGLISLADTQLYKAKEHGRHRIFGAELLPDL
ncbi:diguanylate cyclase [Undibacterium baiyunense]|uniref:diguanylate cyclase n=1 Tax=Undibacterium baiyunense TaxID=2828731 RepID=UPI002E306AC7|nr:diguanylate cyclase [Undibacterium baiyunense]